MPGVGVTGAGDSGAANDAFVSFHLLNVTPKQDVVISPSSPHCDAEVSNLQINFPRLVHPLTVKLRSSQGEFALMDKLNDVHSVDYAVADSMLH
jgi:hypothetical protein